MWFNLLLALVSASAAGALWTRSGLASGLSLGFAMLSLWQVFCATTASRRPASPVILRLGSFAWTMDDFCRGWIITGETGSGKTLGGINAMLWQVSKNCPRWGGICIDDKGLYWETLSEMMRHLGRSDDLILLKVRPEDAPTTWQPPHTFNFLEYARLPFSAKAKNVCDVAASLGQGGDQPFFRVQAHLQMEFAFRALKCAGLPLTLEGTFELLSSERLLKDVMEMIEKKGTPEAKSLMSHYEDAFKNQPAEQLGGVKATLSNRLKYFTDPDIAAVFCPARSSFDFGEIDQGKIICVSIPQRYQVERRYIHTLLKLMFASHAVLRFDRPAAERAKDNLIVLWGDEAQKIVTANDDGTSDYNVVDVIREARATMVFATQTYTSLIPPLNGDEKKAKVLIANLANRITFKAADEDSAKIAADTLGKRKVRKRTYGWSSGRRSTSWTEEDKYWIEPHEFRRLRKFQAVVQHCEYGFRRMVLPPCGTDGQIPEWYRG